MGSPGTGRAIALVDRSISVLSIIVLGGLAYVLSSKTKGNGGHGDEPRPPDAPRNEKAVLFDRLDSKYVSPSPAGRSCASFGWEVAATRPDVRACWAGHLGALASRGQAPHAEREVILHDLANLRLAQEVVGSEGILDTGRGMAGRDPISPK